MGELTFKQQRFVDGLLMGLNQEDAYVQAGYKARGAAARVNASRLLARNDVSLALQERRKQDEDAVKAGRERILAEYQRLAFSDPVLMFNEDGTLKKIPDMPPEARACIAGFDVVQSFDAEGRPKTTHKIRLESKKGALDGLAKINGLFVDRHSLEFNPETLQAILGGLPEGVAVEVKAALMAIVKKK